MVVFSEKRVWGATHKKYIFINTLGELLKVLIVVLLQSNIETNTPLL
jgi:hypothetical protein